MSAELFSSQLETGQCQSLGNEDRISELPEALLLQILSLVPTKDAVATCVLSKQWRFLCKMTPNLRFRYRDNNRDIERFSRNVCMCLLSHQAPVLQSLHLKMNFENDSTMDVGTMNLMMGVAFGLRVRELKLRVYSRVPYRFPTSLFNCPTLETLKLDFGVLLDVPFPVCLKALRNLRLYGVRFEDDGSVVNLLSGCSSLENLEVMVYPDPDSGVKTVTIDVPSLQSLKLISDNAEFTDSLVYLINAPSLKHLKILGLMQHESCLIENMPELVEAHIIEVCGVIYETIHGSLTSVKRLSLEISSPFVLTKFPTDRIFNQLVYLELTTNGPEWWNLLMIMLDTSPNLQVLKLINEDTFREHACKRWSQPKHVAECLLKGLETLVWEKYQGEMEDDREVAQYILRNASRLETATFSNFDIQPEKRLEWLKELESVDRASNSCHLVFKQTLCCFSDVGLWYG